MLQPLTGLTEVAQLRGPDRDGYYTKMRPRDLRGGGDGGGGIGSGASEATAGYSTSAEECTKLLGGPSRSYEGKAMKSTLLEVVVRPPIDVNIDAAGKVEEVDWEVVEKIFTRVVQSESEEEDSEEDQKDKGTNESNSSSSSNDETAKSTLNKKIGMDFENVGGLDTQLDDIAVSPSLSVTS